MNASSAKWRISKKKSYSFFNHSFLFPNLELTKDNKKFKHDDCPKTKIPGIGCIQRYDDLFYDYRKHIRQ